MLNFRFCYVANIFLILVINLIPKREKEEYSLKNALIVFSPKHVLLWTLNFPAPLTFWPSLLQDTLKATQAPVAPRLFWLCWRNMELLELLRVLLQLLGVLRVLQLLLGVLGLLPATQLAGHALLNLPQVGTNSEFNTTFTEQRTFKYSSARDKYV